MRNRYLKMPRHLARLAFCAAAAMLAGSEAQAVLTPEWTVQSGASYFPNDANTRAMTVNPVTGNLLLVRSTPTIAVLKASDGTINGTGTGSGAGSGFLPVAANFPVGGSAAGTANGTVAVTGGAVATGKIRTADYGGNSYGIFLCNIATDTRSATSFVKIYHWYAAPAGSPASEDALGSARLIYANNADDGVSSAAGLPTAVTAPVVGPKLPAVGSTFAPRLGDTMAVVNDGNNVQIYMLVADGALLNRIYRFDFTNTGNPATDVVTNVTEIVLSGLPSDYNYGTAARGLAVDGYNGAIYLATNTVFAKFSNAGVYESLVSGALAGSTNGAGGTQVVLGTWDFDGAGGNPPKRYLGTLAEGGESGGSASAPITSANALSRFALGELNTTNATLSKFIDTAPAPTSAVANSNLTGDVAFNPNTGKVYFMATQNQIGAFSIPATPTGVTKTWDRQAGTDNWFDATNWAPDGVPTPQDDVILDNTHIAGAFTVSLAVTNLGQATARTITVGGGASLATLSIPSTNQVRSALIISGDGNPATADLRIASLGRLDYSPSSTNTAGNCVYFADPTATVRTESTGTFTVNTARGVAAFPADLPAGYQPPLYGRTIFDAGSALEFSNVAGTTLPIGGRTLSTLRLTGTARTNMVTAPTNLPITIGTLETSVTGNTLNVAHIAPFNLGGLSPTGTLGGTLSAYPLTITNSLTWPAGATTLAMNGDVIIPAGVTVTANGNLTIGAANGGNLLDVSGTLTRTSGTTTVNSAVAVRNGGQITGAATWTWGANAGLGVVSATGLSSPIVASDFPGMTVGTTVPANFLSGAPTVTNGTWVFCGNVADQEPGAFFSGGTARNITMRTTGSVKLTNNLVVSNQLRLTSGVLKTDTFKLTLGTSTAATGTLAYLLGQNLATIQGTFERWYGTATISNSDFPLSDGTNSRMLTMTTSGTSTTGGTLAVEYVSSDPGGTIDQPISIATTTTAYGMRVNTVASEGFWRITPGNSFNAGTRTATYLTDVVGGFSALDARAGNASVIARPGAGAWTIGATAQTTPAATSLALIKGVQTSSNPTAARLPYRLSRATFAQTIAAGSTVEIGVGLVTPNSDAPTTPTLSVSAINENNAANAVVGALTSTESNAWSGSAITYSLVSGTGSTDNALFNISGSNLRVTAANALNYEVSPTRSVRIRATDGGYPYLSREQVFTITVNDVNEAPTATALSNQTIEENSGFLVGNITVTDPDAGNTWTYTIGGTDAGAFNIVGNQLFFNSPPNFEAQSSYAITLRPTDQGGLQQAAATAFTITVTNANEPPQLVTISNRNVPENTTLVGTLGVVDPDAGATADYTLVSGTGSGENALFTIAGNQLSFLTAPNFEAQTAYSIRVRATDPLNAAWWVERQFTINVVNVNEAPTSLALSNSSIVENTTAVGNLSATDPDTGSLFTYSLVSGTGSTDNALFAITGNALRFASPANFELSPTYSVRIRVTDSGSPSQNLEQEFAITVSDVEEAPTSVNLSNNTVVENGSTTVGTLSAVDDDDAPHTFSLGGTDAALFTITGGNTLELLAAADFGTKPSYSITVTAQDSTLLSSSAIPFTINVTDVPEDPSDILLSNTTIDESLVPTLVGNLAVVDDDIGSTATVILASGLGDTDNAAFQVVGAELRTVAAPVPGAYSIRLRATDNTARTFDKVFAITVNDVADVDGDGVPDSAEVADANGDSTPDRLQPNVASFTSVNSSQQVALVSSAGTLTAVTNSTAPAHASLIPGTNFPFGLVSFTVTGLTPGDTITMTMMYPSRPDLDKLYKFNSGYTEVAGATVAATSTTWSITDGGANDQDGLQDGKVVDPAGPSYFNSNVADWTLLND